MTLERFQFVVLQLKGMFLNLSLSRIFLLLLFISCKKPDPASELSVEDKDIFITNRDQTVNFANYHTYARVDSIRVIGTSKDTIKELLPIHQTILKTIDSLMQKDGYTKVNLSQKPDLGISVSVLKFTQSSPANYYSYIYSPAYYGYVPAAFWGFSGYQYVVPGYYGYYVINVGTLSIDMYDLKRAYTSSDKNLNLIWNGLIIGANPDTTNVDPARIVRDIELTFDQSPYLKDGK